MARGMLYVLTESGNIAKDDRGRVAADDLIEIDADEVTGDLYGKECEWSEDVNLATAACDLKEYLSQFGTVKTEAVNTDHREERMQITFLPGFAEEFFFDRFKSFKRQAKELTLKDFCGDMHSIKMTIEMTYNNMVYTPEESYQTFDEFVRNLFKDKAETYILSSAVLLH